MTHFGLDALFIREVQIKYSGISKDIGILSEKVRRFHVEGTHNFCMEVINSF